MFVFTKHSNYLIYSALRTKGKNITIINIKLTVFIPVTIPLLYSFDVFGRMIGIAKIIPTVVYCDRGLSNKMVLGSMRVKSSANAIDKSISLLETNVLHIIRLILKIPASNVSYISSPVPGMRYYKCNVNWPIRELEIEFK